MILTFSQTVKSEITERLNNLENSDNAQNARFCFLYGILTSLKNFSNDKTVFKTSNRETKETFESLVTLISGIKDGFCVTETQKSNGETLFKIELSPEVSQILIDVYKFTAKINPALIKGFEPWYLGGVFCAVGSVSNPKKGYHLEFSFKSADTADVFCNLLSGLYWGSKLRRIERKTYTTVYMKDSESIADFLTYIGLSDKALDFLNTEIYKDVINKANRIANCDSANIERALAAGAKQIEDIEKIYRQKGREYLSPSLREIADLRLENPDLSLKELGEMMTEPLTRSGVNHRLMKIHSLAAMM